MTVYLIAVNCLLFGLMGLDKKRAVHHQWRIPEKYLLFVGLIGGGIGGCIGMYLFRHKTRKKLFKFIFALGTVTAFLFRFYL